MRGPGNVPGHTLSPSVLPKFVAVNLLGRHAYTTVALDGIDVVDDQGGDKGESEDEEQRAHEVTKSLMSTNTERRELEKAVVAVKSWRRYPQENRIVRRAESVWRASFIESSHRSLHTEISLVIRVSVPLAFTVTSPAVPIADFWNLHTFSGAITAGSCC